MFVLIHVLIALTSIVYTTYAYFQPSKQKLYTGYGLVALTLISGTYLVVSTHSNMFSACETGLFYLGIVSSGLFAAHHKLASIGKLYD